MQLSRLTILLSGVAIFVYLWNTQNGGRTKSENGVSTSTAAANGYLSSTPVVTPVKPQPTQEKVVATAPTAVNNEPVEKPIVENITPPQPEEIPAPHIPTNTPPKRSSGLWIFAEEDEPKTSLGPAYEEPIVEQVPQAPMVVETGKVDLTPWFKDNFHQLEYWVTRLVINHDLMEISRNPMPTTNLVSVFEEQKPVSSVEDKVAQGPQVTVPPPAPATAAAAAETQPAPAASDCSRPKYEILWPSASGYTVIPPPSNPRTGGSHRVFLGILPRNRR